MKINITIMGKTGNGKSTIVNAIAGTKLADTGKGGRVTQQNTLYNLHIRVDGKEHDLNLYDTVGLEISEETTKKTLSELFDHLQEINNNAADSDISLVWFCINDKGSRLEDFEVDLIKKMSCEFEIPFVIVMTQCLERQVGDLEKIVNNKMPEIRTTRILAEDFKIRGGGVIPAYGLHELLSLSINEYDDLKAKVLKAKLDKYIASLPVSNWFIRQKESLSKECVEKWVMKSEAIGWAPAVCIPVVHSNCIKMLSELHEIYGIPSSEEFVESIFTNVVLAAISSLAMFIPVLSAGAAYAYISTVGESYIKTLSAVAQKNTYGALSDRLLVSKSIEKEYLSKKSG